MTTTMFLPSSSLMPLIPSSSPTLLMNSCSPTPLPRNNHIQNQNSKLIYPFTFFFIINSKSIIQQPKSIINIKKILNFLKISWLFMLKSMIFFLATMAFETKKKIINSNKMYRDRHEKGTTKSELCSAPGGNIGQENEPPNYLLS